jgi:hypothetical protein
MHVYLNLIHPWTTGFASGQNADPSFRNTPQAQGYDTNLGGADDPNPEIGSRFGVIFLI